MYNKTEINRLISFINANNGIGDKNKLAEIVQYQFSLIKERSVYYCNSFAIRFCKSETRNMSNTVLGLSVLRKYDDKPFIVCIVTPEENCLLLANSTFLKKISHSSKELRTDNIKGSFNGSDIFTEYDTIANEPSGFEKLFNIHESFDFQENLERLVEATSEIVGKVRKFEVTPQNKKQILRSVDNTIRFLESADYMRLKQELDARVKKVNAEIALAAKIDNVNIRGRLIEYLITEDNSAEKRAVINALHTGGSLPQFRTEDKLGDFVRRYSAYNTATDIKSKAMILDSCPKAYNTDKLLRFLSEKNAVYLIYLLGFDERGAAITRLCSVFDIRLISSTNIIHHWAGRNSRGAAQFTGSGLSDILSQPDQPLISKSSALEFLEDLIAR